MIKRIKSKLAGIFGGASIGAGALGAFGVCHNICLGIIAILAVFGIAVSGMPFAKPFLFLEKYSWIFISIGAVSLLGSLFMYVRHRRMCKK